MEYADKQTETVEKTGRGSNRGISQGQTSREGERVQSGPRIMHAAEGDRSSVVNLGFVCVEDCAKVIFQNCLCVQRVERDKISILMSAWK